MSIRKTLINWLAGYDVQGKISELHDQLAHAASALSTLRVSFEKTQTALTESKTNVDTLNKQVASISADIQNKQNEIDRLKNESQSTSKHNDVQEDSDEILRLESQVQELQEKIAGQKSTIDQLRLEVKGKNDQLEDLKQSLIKTRNEKNQACDRANDYKDKYERLLNVGNEKPNQEENPDDQTSSTPTEEPEVSQEGESTEDTTEKAIVEGEEPSPKRPSLEDAVQLSNGAIEDVGKDFPEITNIYKPNTVRSIRFVYDEDNHAIISKQFFETSSPEDIAAMSRKLAAARQQGKTLLRCGMCGRPVSIGHNQSALFFIHAIKDETYCPWMKSLMEEDNDNDEDSQLVDYSGYKSLPQTVLFKGEELKEKTYLALNDEKSKELGISGVRMDEIVRGAVGPMQRRRSDISFMYKGRQYVIELQHKQDSAKVIVDRDRFYQQNGIAFLWVFGSDSDTSYDYIKGLNYQGTMFSNHRNVFVFDKDAQQASKQAHTLALKCNWLKDDDTWNFNSKDTKSNGILVTLDQLTIDPESNKLYYHDANEEAKEVDADTSEEEAVPNSEVEQPSSQTKSKLDIVKKWSEDIFIVKDGDLKKLYFVKENRFSRSYNTIGDLKDGKAEVTLNHPLYDWKEINGKIDAKGKPIIELKLPYNDGNVAIKEFGLWGLRSKDGGTILSCKYDNIKPWTTDCYLVNTNGKWGIIRLSDQSMVQDFKFQSISPIIDGKALVQNANQYSYIDRNGNEVNEKSIPLHNGLCKTLRGGKWGIDDENGNEIVHHKYDEIGSFRRRLIGVINNEIIKLNAFYDYPIRMTGKLVNGLKNGYNVNIGGVVCRLHQTNCQNMTLEQIFNRNNQCNTLAFINVIQKNHFYDLRILTAKQEGRMQKQGERDTDFPKGKLQEGVVESKSYTKAGHTKLLNVKIEDGRLIKLRRCFFIDSGQDIDFYKIGDKVYFRKIGYDLDADRTIWKIE